MVAFRDSPGEKRYGTEQVLVAAGSTETSCGEDLLSLLSIFANCFLRNDENILLIRIINQTCCKEIRRSYSSCQVEFSVGVI